MLVCHCHRVSDREIRAFAKSHGGSLKEVCRKSGAGTCCGGCMPLVKDIVRSEASSASQRPSALGSRIAAAGIYR